MVKRNVEDENLVFTTDLAGAMEDTLLVFLCVGTPEGEGGRADLSYVLEAAKQIGQNMKGYTIVVSKSTCPVGTVERVRDIISQETSHEFDMASNPEFLKEGNAVSDFVKPDRVVIGTDNERVEKIMKELYRPFVRTGNPILSMNIRTAEFTKYACNTMLASRISMVNEFAAIADRLGVDISSVREGLASDSRIGHHFLFPGLGYGGSCFPKDVVALAEVASEHGVETHMIDAIERVNREQRQRFVSKLLAFYGDNIVGKSFAVWGAAFKPNTDDLREAPALYVIDTLLEKGAKVSVHDPEANEGLREIYGDKVVISDDNYDILDRVDALIVCTEWGKFQNPNFKRMAEVMREKVIFDGRNIYEPEQMAELGFKYFSIGRPDIV
jgi:UDPglucose 6-dehydrogenase